MLARARPAHPSGGAHHSRCDSATPASAGTRHPCRDDDERVPRPLLRGTPDGAGASGADAARPARTGHLRRAAVHDDGRAGTRPALGAHRGAAAARATTWTCAATGCPTSTCNTARPTTSRPPTSAPGPRCLARGRGRLVVRDLGRLLGLGLVGEHRQHRQRERSAGGRGRRGHGGGGRAGRHRGRPLRGPRRRAPAPPVAPLAPQWLAAHRPAR